MTVVKVGLLFLAALVPAPIKMEPLAKEVIRAMDQVIMDHTEWDNWGAWSDIMKQFFTEDMIYDTNWCPDGTMGNSTGIQAWWEQEHIPWNMAFDNSTFNLVM